METDIPPRGYLEWRTGQFERPEDAAYLFGYYLILHCRDEALKTLPADASADMKAAARKAVDCALHNVCDMLEGFWRLEAGPAHSISLALGVQVRNAHNEVIETQEISPCKLDLPIGYWKWAQDREFRPTAMTTASVPVWESKRTDESRMVEDALRAAGFERVDAYRYNSASIRLRAIDPRFEGLSIADRDAMIEPHLEKLPERTQGDIVTLFTFAPSELQDMQKSFREFVQNKEFEEPSPSVL